MSESHTKGEGRKSCESNTKNAHEQKRENYQKTRKTIHILQ